MRVLLTTHSFVHRDIRIKRTISVLTDMGFEVEVLSLDEAHRDGPVRFSRVPMRRLRGSTLRYFYEYGSFFMAMVLWITYQLIRHRDVALVFVNSPPDFLSLAAFPAKLARIPVILDVHDPMTELFHAKGRRSRLLAKALEIQERLSVGFADRVITVHHLMRDLLASRVGSVVPDVVMNVPDTSSWEPLDRDPDSRTMVYTGSIAVRYGLEIVLQAMAKVRSEIPGLRLRLIGEGEGLAYLLEAASRLGVRDLVDVVGVVPWEEVRQAQHGAWAGVNAVIPNDLGHLSFSNKVVEWVGLGLPVIASRTKTLQLYFPEETLWYVDPGDAEDLAATLRALHEEDVSTIEARTARARAALERIGWPVQARTLRRVVREVIGTTLHPS